MVTALLVCLIDRCKANWMRLVLQFLDLTKPPRLRGTGAQPPLWEGASSFHCWRLMELIWADALAISSFIFLPSFLIFFHVCVSSVWLVLRHSFITLHCIYWGKNFCWAQCWAIPGRLANQRPGGLHLHLLSARIKGGSPHWNTASMWMPFQSLCINVNQFVNRSILPPHGIIFEAIA